MDITALLSPVLLSIKVAATATLVALPIAFFLAYIQVFVHFRGKLLLDIIINLPLALPPVVIGYLLLILLSPESILGVLFKLLGVTMLFNWKAAALAAMIVGFPLMVRAIRLSLANIDRQLIQAARLLGAKRLDVLFSVVIPLAWPGLLAGALMLFIRSLGEFGATMMIAGNIPGSTQTIALAIYDYANQPYQEAPALILSVISLLIAVVVLALHEYLLKRRMGGA